VQEWDEDGNGLLWTEETYSSYLKNNFPYDYISEGYARVSNNNILFNQLTDSIALANKLSSLKSLQELERKYESDMIFDLVI
jgi:hypothetical protein